MAINVRSGLENNSNEPRFHFDIYAILEGGQELYFGHETQVNVSIVEMVSIASPDSTNEENVVEKCYISPTKRPHLPPFFFECVCSCVHRFPMLSCQFFCGEKVYISQTSPLGEQEQRLLRPHLADHTVDDTDHGVNFPRRV